MRKFISTSGVSSKGFTLVEVLVFITVLSIFFVSAVTVSTATIRNIKINEHRLLGVRYAQDLGEWLRSQEEIDYTAFTLKASALGITYCFPDMTPKWPTSAGACPDSNDLNPPIYQRYVVLTSLNGGTVIKGTIFVSWTDVGRTYTIQPLTVQFTVFD